jgi:hypothetical protein
MRTRAFVRCRPGAELSHPPHAMTAHALCLIYEGIVPLMTARVHSRTERYCAHPFSRATQPPPAPATRLPPATWSKKELQVVGSMHDTIRKGLVHELMSPNVGSNQRLVRVPEGM